ncbi:MAG: hypothetical protein JO154_10335 [Chitinophaga sp.]|uniref:hypothetical protein n=1 Tax=Chitinophaga sp. TaxID=1869181 RepID=UPI0025B92B5F|nr:hypothetical protein [Chitinophaga sp.]MBV8252992.1 hypothetical protein [Chitinophaga sp.]
MLKKNLLAVILLLFVCFPSFGQTPEIITVNGDLDKFYPVTFYDGGYDVHQATILQIGRSEVHENETGMPNLNGGWPGSVIATIRFHSHNYGNASSFINADIYQYDPRPLIAGWKDASVNNLTRRVIVWLKGGGMTYHYTSNYPVTPVVYDGVQNQLPYQEPVGTTSFIPHTFKTSLDDNVGIHGISYQDDAQWSGVVKAGTFQSAGFRASGIKENYVDITNNLIWQDGWKYLANGPANLLRMGTPVSKRSDFIFYVSPSNGTPGAPATDMEVMRICENGSVGIGTGSPGNYKLAVEGVLGARKIKVTQTSWADYVFHPEYKLASLDSVEKFIKVNRHLPDIPAEKEVLTEGIDVGEMNKKLLQKIEELTLYLIESRKEYRTAIDELKKENEQLKSKLNEK